MRWYLSWKADPAVAALADRHYSRQTPGSPQFAPPGRNVVLRTFDGRAGWVTSWQRPEFVDHAFGDCWVCTFFRNEGGYLSSALILEACAATAAEFGDPPAGGFLTFVDEAAVKSRNPGYCFLMAGFRRVGRTQKRNRLALRLERDEIPGPAAAERFQLSLPGVGCAQ